jgi:hypothetical protein
MNAHHLFLNRPSGLKLMLSVSINKITSSVKLYTDKNIRSSANGKTFPAMSKAAGLTFKTHLGYILTGMGQQ